MRSKSSRVRTHVRIVLAAVGALIALLLAPSGASAQTSATCGYGTGGPFATNLCWFDMKDYNDASARSASGQEMEITLPGGYVASFTLTSRQVGTNFHQTVEPRTTPIENRFAFGSSGADGGYRGVPGKPALYSGGGAGGVALTLSDIEVVDSSGQEVSGYRFVIADAENNVSGENFTWTSDKPLDLIGVLNDDALAGCNVPPGLAGIGTGTVTCTGRGGDAPPDPKYDAVVVGADTPSTIGLSMTTFARSGVAFAIQTSKIQVTKEVLGTRANPTDSFDVFATSPEGSEVGRASTGSAATATTGELTVLPRSGGATYTLTEEATSGSGTNLDDYDQYWSCTNNGLPYTPSGSLTGTSVSVSPEAGDHIACTVTNVSLPPVTCTSNPDNFNTGYDAATGGILADGSNDANWQVAGPFYTPTGTGPPSLALPPPASATWGPPVVGKIAGSWANSPYGNAQWISQPATGGNNGDWYYRYRFLLDPSVDPDDFSLRMNFLADNAVAEVYVNDVAQSGKTTGLPQNTSAPYTYTGYTLAHAAQTTLNNDWQTGLNTIVVQIKSFGPAEGFLAQIVPTAICPVDLAVTKSASPDPYTPGQALTYEVEVTNGGPATASGLTVSDPLPAALAGAGFTWTCSATAGSSCAASGSGDVNDAPSGSYPGPSVAPGGTLTYTVTGTVPLATSGSLSNTATVTPPTGTQDPECTPSCSATTSTPSVPLSDLALTKSADPTVVDPGQQTTYTLTATNNGPDTEPDATLTDTLPSGVTYVSDDAGCDTSALPQVTCDLGEMTSGATRTVHITVSANMAAADTTQTNTAAVDGQNLDRVPQNNEAEADVFVRPVADLEIEKTADPGTVNPGDPVTFTLVVTNNGPDESPSTQVVDQLPAGVMYSSDDAGCDTASLPQLTCGLGAIPSGESRTIEIEVTVNGDAGSTVQTNSATVSGTRTDPNEENNSDEVDLLVLPLSDLSVTKSAPATVRAGQLLTYTLAWANDGPSDSASQTAITDTLPSGVSYVSDDGGCDTSTLPIITCNLGAVANGASGTIQITVAVDPATRGEIENTASIAGPDNDQNPSNNSDDATTQVDPQLTDLAIQKSADADVVDPGDLVTYTLEVTNNGPDDSLGAQVTDTLPAALRYESDDAGCDTSALPKITCDVGPLPNGNGATIEIETTMNANAGGTVQDNTATVTTSSGTDTNPDNDSDTARVLVTPLSDLSVTKDVSAAEVRAGQQLTYTLSYANAGPTTSDPTTVTDTLPAGVTYVSDDTGCDVTALPEISCDVGSLAQGDSGSVEIVVSVDRETRGQIENTASIDGPNEDHDPSDNEDSATTQVNAPLSDLSLDKTAPGGPFKAGDQIPYTLTVTNDGPDEAPDVVVTDTLPAGLSYISDDADCDTSALPEVECNLGTLPNGASRELTITARVDSANGGSVENSASVTSANEDPDPGDDGDSAVAGLQAPSGAAPTKCFFGNTVTILGTNRPETIVGTPGRDVINGRRGNDVIIGLAGNDLICGGAGDDLIKGGRGNDRVKGSADDDVIHGNRGNDWLRGAPGDDRISGRQGKDRLMGNNGDDRLRGRQGNDELLGGPGVDWGNGGPGHDRAKGLDTAFSIEGLLG
jgi:uncharacterized repeat protein (TIGR01451 family)